MVSPTRLTPFLMPSFAKFSTAVCGGKQEIRTAIGEYPVVLLGHLQIEGAMPRRLQCLAHLSCLNKLGASPHHAPGFQDTNAPSSILHEKVEGYFLESTVDTTCCRPSYHKAQSEFVYEACVNFKEINFGH